jgi:hypothetical protein
MMRIIFFSTILIIFQILTSSLSADDHKKGHGDSKRHEIIKEYNDHYDNNEKRGKKDDHVNEATGQIALWLLVSANLTVFISIIIRGINRFIPLAPQTTNSIKRFNRFHKKYLMRFHYVLNPIGLCMAFFHFLLSSCRSSPFPELGLLLMTLIVGFGLMLKFKASPKWMRKFVYRLHISSAGFSIMLFLIVVGHLMVD